MTSGIVVGALVILGLFMSFGLDFIRNQLKTILDEIQKLRDHRAGEPLKEVKGPIEFSYTVPVSYEQLVEINRKLVEEKKALESELTKANAKLATADVPRAEFQKEPFLYLPKNLAECKILLNMREEKLCETHNSWQKAKKEGEEHLKRAIVAEDQLRKALNELEITKRVACSAQQLVRNPCSEIVGSGIDWENRCRNAEAAWKEAEKRIKELENTALTPQLLKVRSEKDIQRIEELERSIKSQEQDNISLRQLAFDYAEKIKELETSGRERAAEIADLNKALESRNVIIRNLEGACEDYQQANRTLEKTVHDSTNALNRFRYVAQVLKSVLNFDVEAEKDLTSLASRILAPEPKVKELEGELSKVRRLLAVALRESEEAKKARREISGKCERLEKEFKSYRITCGDMS